MKIVTNEKLVKRSTTIAQFSGLLGMGVLLFGMYILWTKPESYALIWLTVLGGFLLSQVGIYYMNRFGRRPRPDEHLDSALKSLEDSWTIYHYRTPTPHLLVGPGGIWILNTRHQKGNISFDGKRYRQKGGGFLQGYMRLFGQESIGRPDTELAADQKAITRFLEKKMPELELPPIQGAVAFTAADAELEGLENAPYPMVPLKKLKEVIRKAGKEKMPAEKTKAIQSAIWAEED
jgi:hypothetical protein